MSLTLHDEQGRTIQLGQKLGEGGEGAVYELLGAPDLVAKTYKGTVDSEKIEKLRAMPALASPDVLRVAAWPTKLLFSPVHRSLAGIAMPRVTGHQEIHQLYSPPSRRAHFPEATWDFLVHVAMNCAAAFETVHAAGQVIGDVNQSGILVSKQGTVRLIDCDSFQVESSGRTYYCVVGVPLFTPPELQGLSTFRGVKRSPNHDNFGLALLIFHLLFMGRHPFAGRFSGRGDMPIEKAIAEGRFAFSANAASFQMSPPPHALGLNVLLPQVGAMFERAFASPSSSGLRPTAGQWREALMELKGCLAKCQSDQSHIFARHLSICPWCRIEEEGGPAFFVASAATLNFDAGFDLLSVWREIQRVSAPPGPGALDLSIPIKSYIPTPVPVEARFDLIATPPQMGPAPVLQSEPLPDLPPYRSLTEMIPADPAYVALPSPQISMPSFRPAPSIPIQPKPIDISGLQGLQGKVETQLYGGTTALLSVAVVITALFQPVIAAFLSPLPLVFGIAWGWCLYHYRAARAELNARLEREAQWRNRDYALARAQYEAELARWEMERRHSEQQWEDRKREAYAAWQQAEAENQRKWQSEKERLATLRQDAPLREASHRRQWEAECVRIEALRREIEGRNLWAKAQWTQATEKYQTLMLEAQHLRHERDEAKRRFETEMSARLAKRTRLSGELDALKNAWITDARRFSSEWQQLHHSLEQTKQQYEMLKREYDQELGRRQGNQKEAQLRDYLEKILIADETIPNFGKGRKALLAANGIETALDVTEDALANVRNLGPKLSQQLMEWRIYQEAGFRFDAAKGIPAAEIRSLQAQFQGRRQSLQRTLRGGREQVENVQTAARSRLHELQRQANEAVVRLAQADADVILCQSFTTSYTRPFPL